MRKLIALAVLVAALAVPASASAHGNFRDFYGPLSGGSHNLTCNEAIYIIAANNLIGGLHGGLHHWGSCIYTDDRWPTSMMQRIGWRANDGSLMYAQLRENYCYCAQMLYQYASGHQ